MEQNPLMKEFREKYMDGEFDDDDLLTERLNRSKLEQFLIEKVEEGRQEGRNEVVSYMKEDAAGALLQQRDICYSPTDFLETLESARHPKNEQV